jgi:NADH-quinone oxidoreductase subunit C
MSAAQTESEALKELGVHVAGATGGAVLAQDFAHGELTLRVAAGGILSVLAVLRDDPRCQFKTLIDICGVDYLARAKRFDVVYHLLSMHKNRRIRVVVETDEATPVPSAVGLWPVADWYEREAFDMFGILFSDHPDLRRILTDYGFQGFPLRKDFPLTGFVEVRYDPTEQRVVYEPVKLTQAYRNFDFLSPWEGMLQTLPGDEKAKG